MSKVGNKKKYFFISVLINTTFNIKNLRDEIYYIYPD